MTTNEKSSIRLFEDHKVRTSWDKEEGKWYFSVVDIIAILTESKDPRNYWKVLKNRLRKEGSELVTNCNRLRMPAADGKHYKTDVLDTEGVFRLVQSVPSPKAEPFKLWLAKVGRERTDEMQDPELAINRALLHYRKLGYSDSWISQRLKSVEIRKALTDEWRRSGVESDQYGFLTDIITQTWAGMKTKDYKEFKGLKKENLRDNMSDLELVLNMLAEVSATEISKGKNPKTMQDNIKVAQEGGTVAKNARLDIEAKTGTKIITDKNAKDLRRIETKKKAK